METSKKRGALIMWCPDCGELDEDGEPKGLWFRTTEEKFRNRCPKCRQMLTVRRCTRCGHKWTPRDFTKLAAVCPKCSSPLWNRERVLDRCTAVRSLKVTDHTGGAIRTNNRDE